MFLHKSLTYHQAEVSTDTIEDIHEWEILYASLERGVSPCRDVSSPCDWHVLINVTSKKLWPVLDCLHPHPPSVIRHHGCLKRRLSKNNCCRSPSCRSCLLLPAGQRQHLFPSVPCRLSSLVTLNTSSTTHHNIHNCFLAFASICLCLFHKGFQLAVIRLPSNFNYIQYIVLSFRNQTSNRLCCAERDCVCRSPNTHFIQ